MLFKDVRYAVEGDADDGQAQREEQDELYFSADRHGAADNDGNGKDDEEQVGKNVARGHGDELHVALTALSAWIGQDLPIVVERLAFGEVTDDDGNKGEEEGPAEGDEGGLVGALPGDAGKAL